MLHAQIELCCVARSYLDTKQIEAVCLLVVGHLPALHYIVYFLHSKPFIMPWVAKLQQTHELCDKVFY